MNKLACAAVALVSGMAASGADASVMITGAGLDAPGGRTGLVNYTPGGLSENAGIGRIRLEGYDVDTNAHVSLASYCVDVLHFLSGGLFSSTPLASLGATPLQFTRLNALLSHADPLVVDADTSAAAQLAVWEIVFEDSANPYDAGSGAFNVTGGDTAAAITLANTYLGHVTDGTWTASPTVGFDLLTAPGNQSQLLGITVPAPPDAGTVPEPATWGLMILGFGLVGGAARRRRGRSATALA